MVHREGKQFDESHNKNKQSSLSKHFAAAHPLTHPLGLSLNKVHTAMSVIPWKVGTLPTRFCLCSQSQDRSIWFPVTVHPVMSNRMVMK